MIEEIKFCPTLKPTLKEFQNFQEYMEKLENEYSSNYGMVKVTYKIYYGIIFYFRNFYLS